MIYLCDQFIFYFLNYGYKKKFQGIIPYFHRFLYLDFTILWNLNKLMYLQHYDKWLLGS